MTKGISFLLVGLFIIFPEFNGVLASTFEKAEHLYQQKKYEAAIKILQPLANNGDTRAQNLLGWVIVEHNGGSEKLQNIPVPASLRYWKSAAMSGDAEAAGNLDYYYQTFEKDYALSKKWWLEAAKRGDSSSLQSFCMYPIYADSVKEKYLFSDEEVFYWCNKAAYSDNSETLFSSLIWMRGLISDWYYNGTGVKQNRVKSFALLKTLAQEIQKQNEEKGQGQLFYSLAYRYQYGQGTTKDSTQAYKWYKAASQDGHKAAQYSLAQLYGSGSGTLHDNVKAHMWANIAGSNGVSDAPEFRRFLEEQMDNAEIKRAGKMARRCKKSEYNKCD